MIFSERKCVSGDYGTRHIAAAGAEYGGDVRDGGRAELAQVRRPLARILPRRETRQGMVGDQGSNLRTLTRPAKSKFG